MAFFSVADVAESGVPAKAKSLCAGTFRYAALRVSSFHELAAEFARNSVKEAL
jgi:hypothetical protein